MVAELETAPLPSSPLRRFEAGASPAAARIAAPASNFTAGIPVSDVPPHSAGPGWFWRRDEPVVGATSPAGLPTRMPNPSFAPGSLREHAGQQAEHQAGLAGNRQQLPGARRRSAEEARTRLGELQHGFLNGHRPDAPPGFGADET
jgi:hypothetical protein